MAGVKADIALSINAVLTGSNDLGTPKLPVSVTEALQFTAGTNTIGKADILFSDTRTLAASANEDLDVAGVLADAFGATIAAAEIVLLFIKARPENTNAVNVTRPATNGVPIYLAAGDGRSLLPGEFELIASQRGIGVTAATADKINIANAAAGTSVTYDVLIIARTVAA